MQKYSPLSCCYALGFQGYPLTSAFLYKNAMLAKTAAQPLWVFTQPRKECMEARYYSNLDYGFVEQTENLMLPDCAKEPQFEKAYRLLNLSDHEFNAIRNGSLESLGEDRTRLILDKALSWAAQNYAGWDLYRHLRDELGMSNEEIGKAGFDLDEFYEDEAADSAEYEVEADYGEEL